MGIVDSQALIRIEREREKKKPLMSHNISSSANGHTNTNICANQSKNLCFQFSHDFDIHSK